MDFDQTSEAVFGFASFEVVERTQELRKNGVRIHLAGQPFQILLYLLHHPGETVTRSELRNHLWSDGTYVEFDHALNAAMNRIRRALGDTADRPRFIETVAGKGYRFIGTLNRKPELSEAPEESAPQELPPQNLIPQTAVVAPERRRWWLSLLTVGVGTVAIASAWLWRSAGKGNEMPDNWRLSPLSINAGFETTPALSPNGKVLAYSADPGLTGKVDLYLRHLDGSDPIQLTTDGAGNRAPDFSPDGNSIVFESNRDGGGIYHMPSLGGEAQLVFRGKAHDPKFSPDGKQIAFWTGATSVALAVRGSAAAWIVSVRGGEPRRVAAALDSAKSPIWFPDGKSILIAGYSSTKALDANGVDWWKASLAGKELSRAGLYANLVQYGLQKPDRSKNARVRTPVPWVPSPACWATGSDEVISSISTDDDNENVWSVGISARTGEATGTFRRLTKGSAHEETPSCGPDGTLAFTSVLLKRELWSLPLNGSERSANGKLHALLVGANEESPALSVDGRTIAFTSDRSGRHNIWMRNLESGAETHVERSMLVQNYPVLSPSGQKVAYSVYGSAGRELFMAAPGCATQKLCEGCTRATDWTRDETKLLTFAGSPYQIGLLDVTTHEQVCLLKHPSYSLLYAKFSPDQKWISFTIRQGSRTAWIAVAPFHGDKPITESEWRRLAEVEIDDYANWSSDGRTLLFTSSEDGHPCLWALPFASQTGRTTGNKFAVQHLHGQPAFEHGGWTSDGKQVVLSMVQKNSNVWTMSR